MFLTFYTTAELARFFQVLSNMSGLSSRISDLGVAFGSTKPTSSTPADVTEHRQWMFKLYRYLNLYHWLVYKDTAFAGKDPSLLVTSGLATEYELQTLKASEYCYSVVLQP